MASIISYESARAKQQAAFKNKYDETHTAQTRLIGHRGNADLPLAHINAYGPGRVSPPHFHDVDQFQIMLEGGGKMGRKDIAVNSIHYSNAYTPYGPFVADPKTGLTCLIIRARPDSGAQNKPEALATLARMTDRHPWQVTHQVMFPDTDFSSVLLTPVPEIRNEHGLATYALRMKSNATALTPDPSTGNGLFVVLLRGSLLHENQEFPAFTLVHVGSNQDRFQIQAGSNGLEALIVQFPKAHARTGDAAEATGGSSARARWHCSLCSFVYDERLGLPEEGIAAGTRWEELPEAWTCPDCAAGKTDFHRPSC